MKLYLAGPLFTAAERAFNVDLARALVARGYTVWLPQENEPRELTGRTVFAKDIEGVDWSDAVVACMDGADPDSGTCFECGYAYHKKPIVTYRTDMRGADDGGLAPFNLMLWASSSVCLELQRKSADEIADAIHWAIVGLQKGKSDVLLHA